MSRLSVIGVRVIGAVCALASAAMFAMGALWLPSYHDVSAAWADEGSWRWGPLEAIESGRASYRRLGRSSAACEA